MSKANASALVPVCPTFAGTPYSELDCQAYVEACLRKIGVDKNLTGSNAWYRYVKQHGWVGTPEECKKSFGSIPAGAFLFILKQDGKEPEKYKGDGIGNVSHIGIYTKTGLGAWHSSASKGMVCESTFQGKTINGGWNRIGLWTDTLDYGGTAVKKEEFKQMTTATVYARSGNSVNMRAAPSKSAALIMAVPVGETVGVGTTSDGWASIEYKGNTGYMMTEFLKMGDDVNITIRRSVLEDIYRQIGNLLGK